MCIFNFSGKSDHIGSIFDSLKTKPAHNKSNLLRNQTTSGCTVWFFVPNSNVNTILQVIFYKRMQNKKERQTWRSWAALYQSLYLNQLLQEKRIIEN